MSEKLGRRMSNNTIVWKPQSAQAQGSELLKTNSFLCSGLFEAKKQKKGIKQHTYHSFCCSGNHACACQNSTHVAGIWCSGEDTAWDTWIPQQSAWV